jgi:hypothetical protein
MRTLEATNAARPAPDGAPEPTWLRDGPLLRAGGVTVLDGLADRRTFAMLCAEAQAIYPTCDRQVCDVEAGDDGRRAMPARSLCSAGGGPAQDAFYASSHLHHALRQLCGGPLRPTGSRGSYSYYVQPGDFLGLHVDILACDVTLITVLTDTSPADGAALAVHRRNVGQPLSVLRDAGGKDEELVKAAAGQHIVILGGLVPHRVLPLRAGGQRVISALCFEALPHPGRASIPGD